MKRSTDGRARGFVLSIAMFSLVISAGDSYAQQPVGPNREHLVKNGDTLWDLARVYLNNPYLWPLIYEANKNIVNNPHRIFPTERLVIPPLPGETRPVGPELASTVGNRTRFYTAPDTAAFSTLITSATGRVRRVEPREYYATPWLADTMDVRFVGQVFMPADPRGEDDKLAHTFHPFEEVYLTYGPGARPKVGDQLLVVSIGRRILPYGRLIEPTGVVRIDSLKESTMVAMVTHQFGEMQTGDLLLPMDSFPNLYANPVAVANGAEGVLIDFFLQQPLLGVTDLAFVSLGAGSVQLGDELAAYLPQRQPDKNEAQTLPERPIARMLVTRVGPRGATVRVVQLQEPALKAGLVVRVVRRMP